MLFVEILVVLVPILLSVAFMTIIERKVLASMQRRLGPNIVGFWGTLQPFSDALKLVVKEQIIPSHANKSLFIIAPMISLNFSLLGWAVIPFGSGLALSDSHLGVLITLALSSVGIYGVLFSGWSSNSKYSFLGSLRSTAQMISYELILSSTVLAVIFIVGSLNFTALIEWQQAVWFIIPLIPLGLLFYISQLAETNRVPFDLPEAESELVAGYFTEYSGMIFVFFFLAEYCSIVLMSALADVFFLGGYLMPFNISLFTNESFINLQSILLGIKTCIFCFLFVWLRATLPRVRFDQLITLCWVYILPIVFGLIVLVIGLIVGFNSLPF
jgi:NADH-ubiquinone oxidoreductase chain 1